MNIKQLLESRGHKILATKMANMSRQTQAPANDMQKSNIENHLANHDINASVSGKTVKVHSSDVEAAKRHLTRVGYTSHEVVGGLNEAEDLTDRVKQSKDDVPFEPDAKPKRKATPGKHGIGFSTARHLARQGMAKVMAKEAKEYCDSCDRLEKDCVCDKKEVKEANAKPSHLNVNNNKHYNNQSRISHRKGTLRDAVAEGLKDPKDNPCWSGYHPVGTKKKNGKEVPNCVPEETQVAEDKSHKNPTGGLTQKGRDAYNRETGGNLQAPVTTPPSKLDPDSKAAKRRKSFCARMGGNKGPMKDEKGEPTRKALALRKWNC